MDGGATMTVMLAYDEVRELVSAIVPQHIITDGGDNLWFDYGAAVAAICAAFNHACDGPMANFIDGMVADEVEDTYGALLPDWQQRERRIPADMEK